MNTAKKESRVYTIADFYEWHNGGLLNFAPHYQRNSVWEPKTKSYFLDTILNGYPIPPIFIRSNIETNSKKVIREVIDGQQRIRTILDFLNNEITLHKHQGTLIHFFNKKFSDLTESEQDSFLGYSIPVEIITEKNDSIIYDIFARLNTNSAPLNAQEKRNAAYHGVFKIFIYEEAKFWKSFFSDFGIYTQKKISRMEDVEFLSTIAILLDKGVIDEPPKKIDEYYKENDTSFGQLELIREKLNFYLKLLSLFLEKNKDNWNFFNNPNYLYTLIGSFERMKLFDKYKKDNNLVFDEVLLDIYNKIQELDLQLSSLKDNLKNSEKLGINVKLLQFFQNHKTHTTQLQARNSRIEYLSAKLQGEI